MRKNSNLGTSLLEVTLSLFILSSLIVLTSRLLVPSKQNTPIGQWTHFYTAMAPLIKIGEKFRCTQNNLEIKLNTGWVQILIQSQRPQLYAKILYLELPSRYDSQWQWWHPQELRWKAFEENKSYRHLSFIKWNLLDANGRILENFIFKTEVN